MLVWEDITELPSANEAASGDASIRAKYLRLGIIKVKSAEKQQPSVDGTTAKVIKALESLAHQHGRLLAGFGVSSYEQLVRTLLADRIEPSTVERAHPSAWAALVHALNIKQLTCAAFALFSKGACTQAKPHGKGVGFFSRSKVDARNAP
ncbi:MAG TPA: hypothetical protein VFW43_01860 [Polaromonas sp.]|nr:hypothetical protein [Polaromonas sp.]